MDDQELELDSESNDTTGQSSQQSLGVRKNIAIKLKGKGRGRGRVKAARTKKPVVAVKKSVSDEEEEEMMMEKEESTLAKFDVDLDADISKLEAPIFTTIDRGPPEPMHRNTKLKWTHRVNLIGEKLVNPMIHCCEKCLLPILIYGRMIPCKHVFCLDCAKKSDKACARCSDKVQRVEQTGLGTVFMCTYGGSRHGTDGCRRTYLSQRDLQAHINHRHLRTQASHHESQPSTQSASSSHSVQQPPPQPSPTPVPVHHPTEYENRDPRELRNLHEPPPLRSLPPPHHPPMDMHPPHHNSMVHTHPASLQHPPLPHDANVLQPPPNYHVRDDGHAPPHMAPRPPLYTQLPPVTAPPIGYASPIPVMSTRTNLITVPIQDDTSPGYHSPHQSTYHPPPTHQPPPQPAAYTPQHPPPQHPYSHPPPNHPHSLSMPYTPVSQPQLYNGGPISGATFSQPPPTHFPPPLHPPHVNTNTSAPSIYSNPPPVHHGPPSGPPPTRPPYSGVHSAWANQQLHGPPPPRPMGPNSNPSLGPMQPRPPYYHQ